MINVNDRQARGVLKSIIYRRKLCEGLCSLEAELLAYVQGTNTRYLAGYEISMNDGQLMLKKLNPLEWRQLKLRLEEDHA